MLGKEKPKSNTTHLLFVILSTAPQSPAFFQTFGLIDEASLSVL